MKTRHPYLVLAIAMLGTAPGLPLRSAVEPVLRDFGYGNMVTNRTVPTAVILVNFTNAPSDVVTPYRMGNQDVGEDYRGAERYYSNWFFSKSVSPGTVHDYFREISNGRFEWTPAPVIMLTLPTNLLYRVFYDREPDGPTADRAYSSEIIGRAMDQGLDLARYDQRANGGDGDGVLIPRECTIQLLINDNTLGGGGARDWFGIPGRVRYDGRVTFQDFFRGLRVVEEELIHVLQNGVCNDIYGPSGLSAGFSSMSGEPLVHLDAWHKFNLAWCEPRIHPLDQVGSFVLPAAQLMETNGPVILHDPDRGTREFFVLEYRTSNTASAGGGYDAELPDSGLVIWHAQLNPGGSVSDYNVLYFPSPQNHWRRCRYCRALVSNRRSDWPCPERGQPAHLPEDGGDDLKLGLDPGFGGETGWHGCAKCGQLFYLQQIAASVCPATGRHQSDGNVVSLRRDDDPEALGTRGWERCTQCQTLFRPLLLEEDANGKKIWDRGDCAAGLMHTNALGEVPYTLLWNEGVMTIMTEGSPNLWRGRGGAWHGGVLTPPLRWFDGTRSTTAVKVRAFQPGADRITVDIVPNVDTWVDFAHRGTENGTFDLPFNTFTEGVSHVGPYGKLHIKTGTSRETGHVNKAMTIDAYGGPVRIGRP